MRTKHKGNRRYPVMTKHEGKMGRVEISLWSSHTILKDFKHSRSQITVFMLFLFKVGLDGALLRNAICICSLHVHMYLASWFGKVR